ncbi:hypothetical protein SFBM_1341 [Candidatus Arthromitus sp. SFB-mouse-Japan]|uniref:hypothetical protein n=1 Tax=unclassified Candidatus Neoarthromitus TaxID=2638829 RepID=UPI00021B811A|nr:MULTISPECIES: hypothetical protein [unclassified Candidatus Arthromitus]EIA25051.1 hypothetical protein SFB1_016G1 [Candidatus Arthromitus sp. SFB-1]EIA25299.1 hypothetical protein SFB2_022G2 [Candidatus Arthromitus sp. SFB-2]EIA28409.1 hypothetical protein SFB5_130G3 [Candidatus Arthromitus sp. SFB-5]EIA28828.1 hypothetical protein SFB6_028G9 [Candidatus Arthromitus sp. SFB-co]EIA30118.1 hypothetical protein SFBSU_007G257 [Candidatus Arthromitus sp. SFB-mouse-SU]EIA30270.1 hypothetical pr
MDPRDIWDVEDIFDLVENNHNKFNNNIEYNEFENNKDDNFYDFSNDDLPY